MKKTIAQQLNIKEFPFVIKDRDGKQIYFENSNGFWIKRRYNSSGNLFSYKNSKGYWSKVEYNSSGRITYYENSKGYWSKRKYDSNDNLIYYKSSKGGIMDNQQAIELTLNEIAAKFDIDTNQLKIKK